MNDEDFDDEVYKGLKKHVFMRGKGRRPDLPEVKTVTNKLLLQLWFLKEDLANIGISYSFRELKSLLERLVPHTSHVTESRICHQIKVTLRDSLKQRCDQGVDFLGQEYDFHRLSAPLHSLGITRLHLQNVVEYLQPPSENISVDVVVALENQRQCLGEPPIFVRKWLKMLSIKCIDVSDSRLKSKIESVIKKNKDLTKRQKPENIKAFLNEPFIPESTYNNESGVRITLSCTECHTLKKSHQEMKCLLKAEQKAKETLNDERTELCQQLEVRNHVIKDLNVEKASLTEKLMACTKEIQFLKEHLKGIKQEKQTLIKKSQ